jgi:hypothetical protein
MQRRYKSHSKSVGVDASRREGGEAMGSHMSTTCYARYFVPNHEQTCSVTLVIVQPRAACVSLNGKSPGSVWSVGICINHRLTVNLPPGPEEGNRHIDDAVQSVLRVPSLAGQRRTNRTGSRSLPALQY